MRVVEQGAESINPYNMGHIWQVAAYIWQLNRFFDSLKHKYKVPIINRPQMTENELSVILETICLCMNNDTVKDLW